MGMTPVHVNIASDDTAGFSTHICIPPMPSPMMPSLEAQVEQGWAPGRGKHKITGTVFHRGRGIVQHGHDCGPGIPDEAPPGLAGANAYLPIIMLKSSRKVMFGASTVRMEATAAGCSLPDRFPMLTCGEPVGLPLAHPTANTVNTVLVGMTRDDEVRGWEDIGDAITVDALCLAVSIATFGLNAPTPGELDPLGVAGVDPVKTTIGAVVGLQRSIARSVASGGQEPISVKIEAGAGVSRSVEVKITPATGEVELGGESVDGPAKQSAGVKRGADGTWKGTGAVPPDLFE